MSSHHFVKEQQEPAVFILDTDDLGFETVSPLLEWAPTVLVAQNCLETVLSWGIKIDVILATEAFQKENLHLLVEQYPVKFLTASTENTLDEGIPLGNQASGVAFGWDFAFEVYGFGGKAGLV